MPGFTRRILWSEISTVFLLVSYDFFFPPVLLLILPHHKYHPYLPEKHCSLHGTAVGKANLPRGQRHQVALHEHVGRHLEFGDFAVVVRKVVEPGNKHFARFLKGLLVRVKITDPFRPHILLDY
jgi:hypothetical protein